MGRVFYRENMPFAYFEPKFDSFSKTQKSPCGFWGTCHVVFEVQ